jgi:hypothetical protein
MVLARVRWLGVSTPGLVAQTGLPRARRSGSRLLARQQCVSEDSAVSKRQEQVHELVVQVQNGL